MYKAIAKLVITDAAGIETIHYLDINQVDTDCGPFGPPTMTLKGRPIPPPVEKTDGQQFKDWLKEMVDTK
jgi:hypothetical protein